jgi:hypothetical protein
MYFFKGSQSRSNLRPEVTAVSYLHSGVHDIAVSCAAESDFCIQNSVSDVCKNIRQSWLHCGVIGTAMIYTAVSLTPLWHAQRCHWHRCDMHSGLIDTAMTFTAASLTPVWHAQGVVDTAVQTTLSIFSANSKPSCIRAEEDLLEEKTQRSKISCKGLFNSFSIKVLHCSSLGW